MRVLFVASLFVVLSASAASAAPAGQVAFVERRGLLEVDARCRLFNPDTRAALQAGAGQARSALLRGGWTRVQLDELEQAAVGAARERACDDPRTISSAADVRAGFNAWSRQSAATFPGWERTWTARRFADINGWRLSQGLAPGVMFGVRDHANAQHISLTLTGDAAEATPGTVQLIVRNASRSTAGLVELRGRTVTGLEAGLPSPASAQAFLASARRVEPADRLHQQLLVFEFPDAAFQAMLRLDPREAVEIRLQGPHPQRYLVEVGDIAAARTFLTVRAAS